MKNHDEIRSEVRSHYSSIARGVTPGCCGGASLGSEQIGYSKEELAAAPECANLGLGCGNPPRRSPRCGPARRSSTSALVAGSKPSSGANVLVR